MDHIAQVERVIEAAGGIPALATELGVRQPTVYQWRSGDRKVSPRLALEMERKWPDVASAKSLRPDVFGPAPAAQEAA